MKLSWFGEHTQNLIYSTIRLNDYQSRAATAGCEVDQLRLSKACISLLSPSFPVTSCLQLGLAMPFHVDIHRELVWGLAVFLSSNSKSPGCPRDLRVNTYLNSCSYTPSCIFLFFCLNYVSMHPLAQVETAELWHYASSASYAASALSCIRLFWETARYILGLLFNHLPPSQLSIPSFFRVFSSLSPCLPCSRGMI